MCAMTTAPPVPRDDPAAGRLAAMLLATDQEIDELKAARQAHADNLARIFEGDAHFEVRDPSTGRRFAILIERGSATDWDMEALEGIAPEVEAAQGINVFKRVVDAKAIQKIADTRLREMVVACSRVRYTTKDGSRALAAKVEVTAL
jgi:hypothetical protein